MVRKNRYSTYSVSSTAVYAKWGAAAAIAIAFVSIVYFASSKQEYLQTVSLEAPLVEAPEGAVKERPEDEGGMEIPNQDKQIFDLLAKENDARMQADLDQEEIERAKIKQSTAKIEILEKEAVAEKVEANVAAKAVEEVAAEPVNEDVKSVISATKPEPLKVEVTTPALSGGDWGVQMASFKSNADATKALEKYKVKFPEELGSLAGSVQMAEIAGKGTFYRARFFGLNSKEDATSVCRSLKQQGQGCLHVKR